MENKYLRLLKILFIFLLIVLSTKPVFSQDNQCGIKQIQLDTYDFVLSNLKSVQNDISNLEALIQLSIDFENKKIKKITYYLISPKNSYSGENKQEIKIWDGLHKFVYKKVTYCLKFNPSFDYINIKFRVPLNEKNIQKAIKQVNSMDKLKK